MRERSKILIACTALSWVLAGVPGCVEQPKYAQKLPGQPDYPQKYPTTIASPFLTNMAPTILKQPKSHIAEKGTHVDFTVVATNAGYSLTYQWQFNGTNNIPGATNKSYCIENVQMTDAGAYTVSVAGNGSTNSKPAYLSVYALACGNSTFGSLATPVGLFTPSSFSCPSGGTFQKGYFPTNDDGTPAMFYGPNATSQKGPFQNTQYLPTLTVDTFTNSNGQADTGIRVRDNWSPFSDECCNDDASPPNQLGETSNLQSKCGPLTLGTLTSSKYKLTILYKDPPGAPSSGTITFNWNYH